MVCDSDKLVSNLRTGVAIRSEKCEDFTEPLSRALDQPRSPAKTLASDGPSLTLRRRDQSAVRAFCPADPAAHLRKELTMRARHTLHVGKLLAAGLLSVAAHSQAQTVGPDVIVGDLQDVDNS